MFNWLCRTIVYFWRYKDTFNIPDTTNTTENDSTDANGQEIVFTGISTTHKFTKTGKGAKSINVDLGKDLANVTTFFDEVTTPDTIQAKNPATVYTVTNTLTNYVNNNAATNVVSGQPYAALIAANTGYTLDTVTVTMGGTDITSSAVDDGAITISAVTGNIVITATAAE